MGFSVLASAQLSLRVLRCRQTVNGADPPLEFLGDARIGVVDDILPASARPEGELTLPLVLHERVCGSASLNVGLKWSHRSDAVRAEFFQAMKDALTECGDNCLADGGRHADGAIGPIAALGDGALFVTKNRVD